MRKFAWLAAVVCGVGVMRGRLTVGTAAQVPGVTIRHERGQSVTPAYEGWYKNPDGTISVSFGYFNRNSDEDLDIPIGPSNRIDPGPADQGQPTHFVALRQHGVFALTLPRGSEQTFDKTHVTWTLVSAGQTASITANLSSFYAINALKDPTEGNTPPALRFAADATAAQGPQGTSVALTAVFPAPVTLKVWVTDDWVEPALDLTGRVQARLDVTWSKYRGPGSVRFSESKISLSRTRSEATTTATFSEPGNYMLRVVATDGSSEREQCCWTNGYVKVSVKPPAG
jgi:hypothetical protein